MSSNSAVRSAVLTAFGTGRVGRGRVRNAEKESGARPLGIVWQRSRGSLHARAGDAGGAPLTTVHVTCSLLDTSTPAQVSGSKPHSMIRVGNSSARLLIESVSWAIGDCVVPRGRRVIGRIRRASRRARSVCAERSRRRYRGNDDPPGELDAHLPRPCTSVARVATGAGAVRENRFLRLFPFFCDCASYERRGSLRRLKRLKRRSRRQPQFRLSSGLSF